MAALLGVLALPWWYAAADTVALQQQLPRWQFWALEVQFALFVALSWLNLPPFIRSLELRRTTVAAAGAASLAALLVLLTAVPKTNRIYYDEHIYQGIAQNIADLHRAQMCADGSVDYGRLQCARAEYNKQPYGYPACSTGYSASAPPSPTGSTWPAPSCWCGSSFSPWSDLAATAAPEDSRRWWRR
jgi:hypothetical protein